MIYNLAGLFGINFSIEQALRSMMGSILALIYSLIDYLYNVFVYLSKAQILDNEFIQSIYSKVGMILGIFMIFKLVFSLIQSLIDPDKLTDKKNGFASIIFRTVISIVLLGTTPAIFKEAFKIQNLIVAGDTSDNVIYKLIAGSSSVGNLDNMGRVISSDLYFSFYTDDEEPFLNNGTADIFDYIDKDELNDHSYDRFLLDDFDHLKKTVIEEDKNFYDTVSYLALKRGTTEQYVIEFNWLLSLIVGCFVAWIIAMYCVQVAIRVVQLAYLQLIAPVPILSYISDPDGTFKKWVSQCVSTFLDLFLRMAIIYFVVTMIGDVLTQFRKADGIIFETTGLPSDSPTLSIVKIFIVIGLLLFAQKVPQLLKDLFPGLGGGAGKFSFGLNPKKEVIDPLKQMYNNTPLGWAPKALGWAGKKTIGAIDRKVHNVPKPRGKFGQYIDKLAPEHAKTQEAKRQAKFDANQWERDNERGQDIYDRVMAVDGKADLADENGQVKQGVFKNQEYIDSWNAKNKAKGKVKSANEVVDKLQREVSAVYNNPNLTGVERDRAIEIAEQKLKNAKSNLSAAEGEFKIAEERHKKNQAIYRKDAETEALFNNYADMHKSEKNIDHDVNKINEKYDAQKRAIDDEILRRQIANDNAETAQHFYDELNGVSGSSASDNGAPTEAFSAIAEKYRQEDEQIQAEISKRTEQQKNAEEAQKFYSELNGIGGSSASDNGAPTAENSLMAQLADQAHQEKLQREFMNNDSNNQNNTQ